MAMINILAIDLAHSGQFSVKIMVYYLELCSLRSFARALDSESMLSKYNPPPNSLYSLYVGNSLSRNLPWLTYEYSGLNLSRYIYGDSQENWEKAGQDVQSNSLSYRRTKVDAYLGYILNHVINPYIGTNWSYSHQKRNDFRTANTPGVTKGSVTEEVNSLSFLFGLQGKLPINTKWSFAYFIEYLHPYYSKVENSSVDGWEPSDIDGYAYSFTGQLEYLFTEKFDGNHLTGLNPDWRRDRHNANFPVCPGLAGMIAE